MADLADEKSGKPTEAPALHIDTDWKRQAQEEKRKLVEQAAAKAAGAQPEAHLTAPAAAGVSEVAPRAASTAQPASAAGQARQRGEMPPPGFPSLVKSVMTQVLYYLGDLGQGESINLDMAKYQLDTLGMLEEKTKNNLTGDESHLLDAALYETRTRFINVASQFI